MAKFNWEFSDGGFSLRVEVEKWLARDLGNNLAFGVYGRFSVAQLADGHLLVVVGADDDCQTYEYENFEDMTHGENVSRVDFQPPNFVIRAVARALNITHIRVSWGDPWEIDRAYPRDEYDEPDVVESHPQ